MSFNKNVKLAFIITCLAIFAVNSIYVFYTHINSEYMASDRDDALRTSITGFLRGKNPYKDNIAEVHPAGTVRFQTFSYGTVYFLFYLLFYLIMNVFNIKFIGVFVAANIFATGIMIYYIDKFNSPILFLIPIYMSFILKGSNILVLTAMTAFIFYHLKDEDYVKSAIALAIAVSTKPFPLLIVPFWIFDRRVHIKHVIIFGLTWLIPTFLFGLLGPYYVFKSTILFHIFGRKGYAFIGGTIGYKIFGNYTDIILALSLTLIFLLRINNQLDVISIALSNLSFILFSPVFSSSYSQYFDPIFAICAYVLLYKNKDRILKRTIFNPLLLHLIGIANDEKEISEILP